MASQLRMYRAKEGELDAFVREWRTGVLPLRRKFGFRVEGAWAIREKGEFMWVISYDGPEGFEARDAAYYASPERKAMSPDPARHLAQTDTRLMTSVLP
jgi:hypothetical protein